MYEAFFGFRENPFNLTPDPRYLYLSSYHREALDHLLYGINERKGFIAIIGGIGTGKTTLCRALLSRLDPGTKTALILNSFISDLELLQIINDEFGIEGVAGEGSKKEYIDRLNYFLLENFRQGGNAVLLIDEAQNLSHAVLEQVRMLSNLETEREKLLQIVLVGQSELKALLNAPSMRQLNERILVRYDLKPLDPGDIKGYVEHRLAVAGGSGQLKFSSGAYKRVYTHSLGNPRRINALCDRSLLIAYARERFAIDKEIIDRAEWELKGERSVEVPGVSRTWKRFAAYPVMILVLILVAGYGGWSLRDKFPRPPVKGEGPVYVGTIRDDRQEKLVKEVPPPQAEKEEAPKILLDETSSIALLFSLFRDGMGIEGAVLEEIQPALVYFDMPPEYHVLMKRPFRVKGPAAPAGGRLPGYLLVKEVKEEGAVVIDAGGKERFLERTLLMEGWGGEVSFVYPSRWRSAYLSKGSEGSRVIWVQNTLKQMGYMVEATGHYDEKTERAVRRFQREFGLGADGIVGPRTSALLYQMSEP
ncbi:MAG: AAA family ATPase [Deltaproteobacteria bacterium]|nr:AAA family ATPase [Deltaproteobacteria bacterium]